MTILKVMFAVAIGTYIAYEITTRTKKIGSSGSKRLAPAPNRIPYYVE